MLCICTSFELYCLIFLCLSSIRKGSFLRVLGICVCCFIVWYILFEAFCFATGCSSLRRLLINFKGWFWWNSRNLHLVKLCVWILKVLSQGVQIGLPFLWSVCPIYAHTSLIYCNYCLWLVKHMKIVSISFFSLCNQVLLLINTTSSGLTSLRHSLAESIFLVFLTRLPWRYRSRW